MVADLREMQENQWVSEIRIDKQRFVDLFNSILSHNRKKYKNSHSRAYYCDCYCLMNIHL